jgi:DNA uptake protein ComE-like DNA-binding protein
VVIIFIYRFKKNSFNKYLKIYLIYSWIGSPCMKSTIKNYLSISKKEWNGMVVLVILIALILGAPYVFQLFRKDSTINAKDFNNALAVLEKGKKVQGGDHPPDAATFSKKVAPGVVIELNTADSAKLTGLRGIGPSFAMRIIRYRDRLGGFYRKEQVKEVFGLDSSTYAGMQAQVRVDASHVKRIPINSVAFEDLSRFPYLTYKQMNAIIRFREQHGDYASLDDMRNIAILDDGILRKIEPYLVFK